MATRKILFRGQTRHKGEKTSISGKPLPGIWVTGGIFPQNKGYERAIIYTQDPKVEKHGKSPVRRKYIELAWKAMTKVSVRFVTTKVNSEYGKLALATAKYLAFCER